MKKISKRIMSVAAALALVVVLGVCLTACGSNEASFDTYRNRLEDAGYTVMSAKSDALQQYKETIAGMGAEINIDDVDWLMIGTKGTTEEDGQMVVLMRFKNESQAKEMMDEAAANEEGVPEGFAYDRQGNVIVVGMEAGVNIALGK